MQKGDVGYGMTHGFKGSSNYGKGDSGGSCGDYDSETSESGEHSMVGKQKRMRMRKGAKSKSY